MIYTRFSTRTIRFDTFKKSIAVVQVFVLGLSNIVAPIAVAAPIVGAEQSSQATPEKKVIEKEFIKEVMSADQLPLADMAYSNDSARARLAVSVQELKKEDFKADEVVSVTVNNPDRDSFTTKVLDVKGREIPVETRIIDRGNETEVLLAATNQFVPGEFTLAVKDAQGYTAKQDFSWGVLALNTDKAVYTPNEKADISIGVLDAQGEMVCDAEVELKIINQKTQVADVLSTKNGNIVINKECHSKAFTLKPDYEATYTFGEVGEYTMELSAVTPNGVHTIAEPISVKESVPFVIKRTSATRLYPPLDYPMNIEVTANQDFEGTITETVPDSFIVTPSEEHTSYDGLKTLYLNGQSPESKVLGSKTGSLAMPFDGEYSVTQGFGVSMTDHSLSEFYAHYGLSGHDGIDFALPMGTPLYAVDAGNVIWSGPGDYGITMIVQHSWGRSYYGHLSKTNIGTETNIQKGSLIGYSGSTGESTGPHLHFGMKPENPDTTNGYGGKVDPAPYLNGLQMIPDSFTNAINSSGVLSASTSADETEQVKPGAVESVPTPGEIVPEAGPPAESIVPFAESTKPSSSTAELRAEASKPAPGVKPGAFSMISQDIQQEVADSESTVTDRVKVLKWQVRLKKGEKTTLSYTYKAPQVSPQFYLLGAVKVFDDSKQAIFEEPSKWQLAADAIGADWYDLSWRYRKPLTINNTLVGATLTDFPVLVSLTSDANLSASAQGDGDDILFTSSDGETKLAHEIESYASGTLVAWVEVPTVADATDTDIYMYYGNAAASAQENATAVWSANYNGVWHLQEDPSATTQVDSTSNALALTSSGAMTNTDSVAAKILNGLDFDGSDDYVFRADNALFTPSGDMSLSAWVRADQLASTKGEDMFMMNKKHSLTPFVSFQMYMTQFGNAVIVQWINSGGTNYSTISNDALTATTWFYLVYTKSGTTTNFFIDGAANTSTADTTTGTLLDGDGEFHIGGDTATSKRWDGIIDESRLSTTGRASGWISTEFNNQNSPATFYAVGGEETRASAPLPGELMRHGKYFSDGGGGEQPFVY